MRGRKRHLLVDTEGLIVAVKVHAANIQDRDGARLLLEPLAGRLPRMKKLWVDSGYAGKCVEWIQDHMGWDVEVTRKLSEVARGVGTSPSGSVPANPAGFHVVPRRWVVERTFAWLGRYRRLSKDYEGLATTSEAWIRFAMIRLLTRRLASGI